MYEVTSIPLVRRTLAALRRAEFGFFGVVVYTRVQTPRFCGFCSIAGTLFLAFCGSRPLRISWLIVGMKPSPFVAASGGYFAQGKSGRSQKTSGERACASLSNVQLLPARGVKNHRSRGRAAH